MNKSQPSQESPKPSLSGVLVGLGIVVALGVAGIVGVAHGARWMGLTHFGGIIHGAEIQITSWSPNTPGIKIVSDVEPSRGNARYMTAGVMAWVYMEGQEEPLATYLSKPGQISGGGEQWTIGLWPKTVVADVASRLEGVNTVRLHVEEVEMPEAGGLVPIKHLGDFTLPVSR